MQLRSLVDIALSGELLEATPDGFRSITLQIDSAAATLARSEVARGEIVRIPGTMPVVLERALALWQIGATPLILPPHSAWSDHAFTGYRTWQWSEHLIASTDDRTHGTPDVLEPAAVIHASSGSTAQPHFVRRTPHSIAAEVERYAVRYGLRRGSHALILAPVFHSFGWGALLAALGAGCRTEVAAVFHPRRALQRLLDGQIDVAVMTPQMLRAMVSVARSSSHHVPAAARSRQIIVGAGAVSRDLDLACRELLGVGVSRNYGSTETGATFGSPPRDDEAVGEPFDGVEILEPDRLAQGELVLRLPERPDAPYRTGDIAMRHADDVVEILGRVDGMTKVNGYNVNLDVLAAAARRLPGVADAVAIAVSRPESPEIVDLCLVLAGPAVDVDAVRHTLLLERPLLRASLKTAGCRELPRDAVGKVSRAEVLTLIERAIRGPADS